ncbi:hypothetical protein B0H14DRAFT_2659329 [Mycena olivaceomarginata]|nr:hypothetical protein B0H14DRAFT_2659329 [Mycena olivaceomarginata]
MGAADSAGWGRGRGWPSGRRGRGIPGPMLRRDEHYASPVPYPNVPEAGTRPWYDKFVILTRFRHRPLLDMSMLGPPPFPPTSLRNPSCPGTPAMASSRSRNWSIERSDDAPPPPRARGPDIYAAAKAIQPKVPNPFAFSIPRTLALSLTFVFLFLFSFSTCAPLSLSFSLSKSRALLPTQASAPDDRALATDERVVELVVLIRVYLLHRPGGRQESPPVGYQSVFKRFGMHEPSADGRTLLERFDDFGNEEAFTASVFQRFDVPLEERIGGEEKHRFRKHNRVKKRKKKKADQGAREGKGMVRMGNVGRSLRITDWVSGQTLTSLGDD